MTSPGGYNEPGNDMRPLVVLLLAAVLLPGAQLGVSDITFRAVEDGPSLPRAVYPPGVPVFLTFRITGFASTKEDQDVNLGYVIQTHDPSNRPLDEPKKSDVKVQLADEDKDWAPKIRYEVQVPPVPEPGTYTVEIAVEDRIGKRSVTARPTFVVDAPKLPDLAALSVQNFRFMHSENDITGSGQVAVFRPGDTVWASFEMAGYKFAAKNRFSIKYGIALTGPDGKLLFEQPNAAEQSDQSFYPKLASSATFSINLDKNAPPGDYTLTIRVRDDVGDQSLDSAHVFRVEK